MQVEVSNGELIDKLTILEIKSEKGLNVDKELDIIEQLSHKIIQQTPQITHLYRVLKSINCELWLIEDSKREHELQKKFDQSFVTFSRLVYMLNDQRAKTKKQIDLLTNSDITEHKSHLSI